MQLLSGGRWVDQTHHKMVKDRNPIDDIHVSLVPGHAFPINCGSQHGLQKSFRFQTAGVVARVVRGRPWNRCAAGLAENRTHSELCQVVDWWAQNVPEESDPQAVDGDS